MNYTQRLIYAIDVMNRYMAVREMSDDVVWASLNNMIDNLARYGAQLPSI